MVLLLDSRGRGKALLSHDREQSKLDFRGDIPVMRETKGDLLL